MKGVKRILLLLLLASVFPAQQTMAQQVVPSLMGTDFWMAFLHNDYSQHCSLIIASEHDCTARIHCPYLVDTTIAIRANSPARVQVPENVPTTHNNSVTGQSYHITTTAPAVVYATNYGNASHDMTSIQPTPTLRNDYIVETYGHPKQQMAIVAAHDSTQVRIVFDRDILNYNGYAIYHAGDSVDVSLSRGQTSYWQASYPNQFETFSGTCIHASKPVAVFMGNKCANVPFNFGACDHIYTQNIPTDYWGRHFIVMPTSGRVSSSDYESADYGPLNFIGDLVTVTARDNGCTLSIEGDSVTTLAAGHSYSFLLANHPPDIVFPTTVETVGLDFYQSEALTLITSSPAMVCFYITGITFGGIPGDPAQVVIPPVEQGISHTITTAYNTERISFHYINLMASDTDVPLMTLNGHSIADRFSPLGNGYSYARLLIGARSHVLDADTGRFLATFYGLGDAESYAYIAGAAMRSADYDVHADRHHLCPGDTLGIVFSPRDPGLHASWMVDGQPYADSADSVSVSFDSTGLHRVAVVVHPVGDTVWELITVHPTYYAECEYDTICPDDTYAWHGRNLTTSGTYVDSNLSVYGCDSVLTLQLTVVPVPKVGFSLTTDCLHYHYTIAGDIVGDTSEAQASWTSTPPDNTLDSQPWYHLELSPTVTTRYDFAITGFCPYDTSFTLFPIRWPHALMTVRPEQLNYDNSALEAYDQSLNADSRQWWIDGVPAGEEPTLYHKADLSADSVLLTLVALNDACADTLWRTIPISHSAVWAPNVFTPDAESNNRFAVVLNEGTAEELQIFNRNGMLVAHIIGANPQWDGTHDGTPCPQGAYVWHLLYRRDNSPDQTHTLIGTITLLR